MSIPIEKGISLALLAIEAATTALAHAQAVGKAIATAQAEGRTELTEGEWSDIVRQDDEARQRLVDAIANASD